MKATVNNVRIKDLMHLLVNLNFQYEAVDITVDPEERRILINGAEDEKQENSNKTEIGEGDLGDII